MTREKKYVYVRISISDQSEERFEDYVVFSSNYGNSTKKCSPIYEPTYTDCTTIALFSRPFFLALILRVFHRRAILHNPDESFPHHFRGDRVSFVRLLRVAGRARDVYFKFSTRLNWLRPRGLNLFPTTGEFSCHRSLRSRAPLRSFESNLILQSLYSYKKCSFSSG